MIKKQAVILTALISVIYICIVLMPVITSRASEITDEEKSALDSTTETAETVININPNADREEDIIQGSAIKLTNNNIYPVEVYITNITGNYNNSFVRYSDDLIPGTSEEIKWNRLGTSNSSKYIAFSAGGNDILPNQTVYLGEIESGEIADFNITAKTGYAWKQSEERIYNLTFLIEKSKNYIDPTPTPAPTPSPTATPTPAPTPSPTATPTPAARYTITFNANGGSVSPSSAQTGTNGRLSSLPTPTLSNCTFAGWFDAASGGSQITTSKVYTKNTTIYAQWDVTITFNGNGGTSSRASRTVRRNTAIGSLPTCTNVGSLQSSYNSGTTGGYFAEWNGTWNLNAAGSGNTVTSSTTFTRNTTIYARQIPKEGWVSITGSKDGYTSLPDWMCFQNGYPARNYWIEYYCCPAKCWINTPGVAPWFWVDANGIMARGWKRLSEAVNNTSTQVTSGGYWYYFLTGQAGHGTNSTSLDDTLPLPSVCNASKLQAGGSLLRSGTYNIDGTAYTFASNGRLQ